MKIVLIILAVMALDWGLAYILSFNKKKQLKRDEDLFIFKLEQILQNTTISQKERVDKGKELCRNTEGKISAAAYFALDCVDVS